MRAYFVDASVVMYAAGAEHPYKEPCSQIITAISTGKVVAATSTEVCQEILHRFSLIKRREEGIRVVKDTLLIIPQILAFTREDVEQAVQLLQKYHGVSSRDAVHAAVMQNNDLDTIISSDKHFDMVSKIRRIDPMDFARAGFK
jgi:predicted nucleic acid-binding protein